MPEETRHQGVTELATRLLAVAEAAYESAPKLVMNATDPTPPPLSWHVAYTSAEFLELLLRLCVMRKVQVSMVETSWPPGYQKMLAKTEAEANRALKLFNIELAQEI